MSDDAPLVTRGLPDLRRWSLRELRRDGDSAFDQALNRILAEDNATTGASAGFQNRI